MPAPPPGFDWDDRKAALNYRQHGVSFGEARRFDIDTAIELEDLNAEHDELRITALGKIGRTLHVFVYTHRQNKIRVISLRKATAQEGLIWRETHNY
jgi:uncharacterized DUF497 family protein